MFRVNRLCGLNIKVGALIPDRRRPVPLKFPETRKQLCVQLVSFVIGHATKSTKQLRIVVHVDEAKVNENAAGEEHRIEVSNSNCNDFGQFRCAIFDVAIITASELGQSAATTED